MAADTATLEYYDVRADEYRRIFEQALPFDAFIATGKPEHQKRWADLDSRLQLTEEQRTLAAGFTRTINVLVLSAAWCPDCMWQLPTLRRVEEASDKVHVRLLDRDAVPELRDNLRIAGAAKIPVAVFLSEDFFECSRYGERTLTTYRAIARYFLGAACPIGEIFDDNQLRATAAEWMAEIERVHWMLRLSSQLRERYKD